MTFQEVESHRLIDEALNRAPPSTQKGASSMDLRHTKWRLQIAATVAYRAAAVRYLVRHSQSGGTPDWSDTDKPL